MVAGMHVPARMDEVSDSGIIVGLSENARRPQIMLESGAYVVVGRQIEDDLDLELAAVGDVGTNGPVVKGISHTGNRA